MPSNQSVYSDIRRLSCNNTLIEWKYCCARLQIRHHFSYDDWHKIVENIETDEELFRANKEGYLALYVAKTKTQKEAFAFVFILVEDPKKNIVSIHGGGWNKKYNRLFLNAYILMNRCILDSRLKLRTSCLIENTRAMKFIKACGFRIYRYENGKALFYLTLPLLRKSAIYKKYERSSIKICLKS